MRKLNELQVWKQYQIEISNRFAALENLNYSENVNRAWENIKENIKISAKDSLGSQAKQSCKEARVLHKVFGTVGRLL